MAIPIAIVEEDLLLKVRCGEVSLERYLDEQTDLAIERIRNFVSNENLSTVRELVREHLRTDPAFIELVRKVTGRTIDPFAVRSDERW